MDNRILERIVISILLILNVFLLCVVLSDELESKRNTRDIEKSIEAVLQENEIALGEGAELVQSAPPRYILVRSVQQETEKVMRLFGDSTVQEDLGGNIMFYRSDLGQAVLRGNGEMDFLFSGGSFSAQSKIEKTAEHILKKIGFFGERKPETVTSEGGHLEYYCCYNGYPVYNAVLGFDFSGNSLYMLSGTRVFDVMKSEESDDLMDSVSVMLRFVELVKNKGFICSRVETLRAGYIMSVAVSGESTLIPVWRIETDTGTVLINASTGEVETLST